MASGGTPNIEEANMVRAPMLLVLLFKGFNIVVVLGLHRSCALRNSQFGPKLKPAKRITIAHVDGAPTSHGVTANTLEQAFSRKRGKRKRMAHLKCVNAKVQGLRHFATIHT